jgi:hypothetical protein
LARMEAGTSLTISEPDRHRSPGGDRGNILTSREIAASQAAFR